MKTKTYPANYKNLATISQFIVEQAKGAGFSESEIYAIQTAVDEACSNIIDHAYGGENLGKIKIKIKIFNNIIQIILIDQGESFNLEDIQNRISPRRLRSGKNGG